MHTVAFNKWLDNRRTVDNCENTAVNELMLLNQIMGYVVT